MRRKKRFKFFNYLIIAATILFLMALFKNEISSTSSKWFTFDMIVKYVFLFFGIISGISAFDIFNGYLKKSLSIGITRTKVFIEYTLLVLEIIIVIVLGLVYYYTWVLIIYQKMEFLKLLDFWFLVLSVLISSFLGFVLGMIRFKSFLAFIAIIAYNVFVLFSQANIFVNIILTLVVFALFAVNYQMIKKKGL
ncbi:MAG: hypothetical protein ACOX4W_06445 [Bacilli bacterium]